MAATIVFHFFNFEEFGFFKNEESPFINVCGIWEDKFPLALISGGTMILTLGGGGGGGSGAILSRLANVHDFMLFLLFKFLLGKVGESIFVAGISLRPRSAATAPDVKCRGRSPCFPRYTGVLACVLLH